MDAREQRGMEIAALSKISQLDGAWIVPSQNGNGTYKVNPDEQCCSCPDYETRHIKCKHQWAVEFTIKRETSPNGTVIESKSVKVTYSQEWTAYNAAQTTEKSHFMALLADLCQQLPQPEQSNGRPRLPLSDMVFACAYKVYSGFSSRRFTVDLHEAQAKGFITTAPHFNSVSNYLSDPALTPLLKELIEQSALPLKGIETDFAVDSSGFAVNRYDRWFDAKYGKLQIKHHWVKTHLICGVKTNIVTSVEATPTETADAPQLAPLVAATARNFTVKEVLGDKAYSSRKNLRAIEAIGATPYIPFKDNTNGIGKNFDSLWNKMWHFYMFNRDTFLQHYHKRSNAETTFSMIKAKFGSSVKSKSDVGQVQERCRPSQRSALQGALS